MSNQDIDFLTVTPEVRELYSIPHNQAVLESYKKQINVDCLSFSQKFLNQEYFNPLATIVSLAIFSTSYVYLRQPAGDVARQLRFERMNPLLRLTYRGVPALSLFATLYFARQCKPY